MTIKTDWHLQDKKNCVDNFGGVYISWAELLSVL